MKTHNIKIRTNEKMFSDGKWVDAKLHNGRFLRQLPKSYKKIGLFFYAINGVCSIDQLATIYKNKQGDFICEMCVDGSFALLYSKIESDYLKNNF